jgi:hypothetical protein
MRKPLFPFVSSEVETPNDRARLHGISTSLDANGIWIIAWRDVLETAMICWHGTRHD